jgi:hypothetical protein
MRREKKKYEGERVEKRKWGSGEKKKEEEEREQKMNRGAVRKKEEEDFIFYSDCF